MPSEKTGYPNLKAPLPRRFWSRFSRGRSTTNRSILQLVVTNIVSLTVPAPCTDRDLVEAIAHGAFTPIPIESLHDALGTSTILRGQSLFGYAGDVIDEIAMNYHNMRWWITDKGLNMGAVIPARVHLSAFDELAGKLTLANWKDDGLSRDAFLEVAKELDKAGFRLKDELQPKPWKAIAQHNQKYSKNAIKSFEQAARNPRFARSVRRRLYVARKKVEGISTGQPEVSFGFDQDI